MNPEKRNNSKTQIRCPNCKEIYTADENLSNGEQTCIKCGFNGKIGGIYNNIHISDNDNKDTIKSEDIKINNQVVIADNSNVYNNNLDLPKNINNSKYNINNLQPFGQLSEERQREIRSMGGKASVRKKILTEALMKGLAEEPNAKIQEALNNIDPNMKVSNVAGAIKEAVLTNLVTNPGNAQLLNVVLDRVEGKLTDKLEVKGDFALTRFTEYFNNFQAIEGYSEDEEE